MKIMCLGFKLLGEFRHTIEDGKLIMCGDYGVDYEINKDAAIYYAKFHKLTPDDLTPSVKTETTKPKEWVADENAKFTQTNGTLEYVGERMKTETIASVLSKIKTHGEKARLAERLGVTQNNLINYGKRGYRLAYIDGKEMMMNNEDHKTLKKFKVL